MRTLLMLVLLIIIGGCRPIIKTVYGIKKPRIETEASVKSYLVKKDVDTTNVLTFPTVLSFAMASEQKYLTIPDAIFFNKAGYRIPYKPSATTCNADVPKFLSDLKNFSSYPADETKTLAAFESMLGLQTAPERPDVTVFITWTKYSGRLNKTKAFEWIRLLDKARQDGISVNYYLLNCDFQEKWNLNEAHRKKLGLN